MLINILYIIAAIIILSVIVVVHEFGHYLAGRLCGIGVIEFSVGFGPKIFGLKRKGIQYSLRAIPLGGFCKFVGEDETNPAPNAMNAQPVWKRAITVASGPLMNFLFAYLICVILLVNYVQFELLPVIDVVIANTPAAEAGFEDGDIVMGIEGNAISYDNDGALRMRELVQTADLTSPLLFTIDRNGETIDISVTPEITETESTDAATGETIVIQNAQIGIQFGSRTYTFGEAVGGATEYMVNCTKLMLDAIKNLVFKGEGVNEMTGPVGIISFVSTQVREGMYMVLYIMFIISLNLGIMNLLPLPALDGGRLVFLLVEAIRRKPIPPEKEGFVNLAGFALLLVLILLVTYQDIVRLVTGG